MTIFTRTERNSNSARTRQHLALFSASLLMLGTLCFHPQTAIADEQVATTLSDEQAAAQVLDKLNQYSSSADWDKYFALYRQDGIFIGTDATERWGMAEFERYSRPTKGWRYDLTSRHLVQHGDVILFDELLNSPSYGVSRGTGTLIKTNGEWKIAQYHLSFPIPNSIAKQITAEIKNAQ
ncbi:nuclear transport factor 2 family protein [Shewanella mangrovisoli]|uniref:nuclear transport factor 2 family protein n=2 Tax=Shewanellaceae TaxID=267890 RepID=UPI000B49B562|nr:MULTISPECIES: nuclear transport factor 2 family protein [unclassified Shewanella]